MFFERAEGGEKALLVHVEILSRKEQEDPDEFVELAKSAGLQISSVVRARCKSPVAGTYIGKGKLEELAAAVKEEGAEVVLFNNDLSSSQERNLEAVLGCKVIDRTGLILDIFAQRARTHEGMLQVELAQLQHMATRLVRGWTHLERQKGGIGLRGPGETQLETDRRLLRVRVRTLQQRLEKVEKQREQARRSRSRAALPVVSIVGYTNAGKSTLFNRMTNANVYVADQLFATLDPTLRRIELDDVGAVLLADTVGFIRHLSHKLVDAFKATLEETVMADLLLHVVDASAPERDDNIEQVNRVLAEIGADGQRQIIVYNKIDRLAAVEPHIDFGEDGKPLRVWISARDNLGIDLLREAIASALGAASWHGTIQLGPDDAKLRAQLYQLHAVVNEHCDEAGNLLLELHIPLEERNRLCKRLGIPWESLFC